MKLILAIFLGMLFGFVLQKVGASNPQRIIGMLKLKDFHLMKAIFLGIGFSSLVLFILLLAGIVDPGNLSVKSSYAGVIVGGVIMGTGWALSGFCPGTGLVAAGAGRKDALFFLLGGLGGAFIFMLVYGSLTGTALFTDLGGKMTLAVTGSSSFPALLTGIPGILVAGMISIFFIIISAILPEKKSV